MSGLIQSGKSKNNSNKKGVPEQLKAQRRAQAEARNADYQKLTPAQRLARLDQAGLTATRERARIQKLMAGGK